MNLGPPVNAVLLWQRASRLQPPIQIWEVLSCNYRRPSANRLDFRESSPFRIAVPPYTFAAFHCVMAITEAKAISASRRFGLRAPHAWGALVPASIRLLGLALAQSLLWTASGYAATPPVAESNSRLVAGTARPHEALPPAKRLNPESIVRLAYERNPTVRAAREEMKAGKHGLTEFRANLSRTEPYIELRSDLSDFPNRRGAFGNTAETVVGLKKETFEGGILSAEVGGSYSRFEFDRAVVTKDFIESGGGALVRTRLELPFFGSRRRQDRIISQAYQESTARQAQLSYLKSYRTVVDNALSYYNLVVYYRRLASVYRQWADDLTQLSTDARMSAPDRQRVKSVRATALSYVGQYSARDQEYFTILMSQFALDPSPEIQVEMPEYSLSPFAEEARTPVGIQHLVELARTNNPTFRVLNDAIQNAELRRKQAVEGKLDVTAFLEGTLFPIGSETFDNRFSGWTVGAGANVRLNDRRVREAARLKAEAQIRQFQAEIEAEEINIRRRILSTTTAVWDNDANRAQMLDVARQKTAEYQERHQEYFAETINIDQLLSTRSDIASNDASLASNTYNTADREATLILTIGQIFEMVGLRIGDESREGEPSGGKKSRKSAPQ